MDQLWDHLIDKIKKKINLLKEEVISQTYKLIDQFILNKEGKIVQEYHYHFLIKTITNRIKIKFSIKESQFILNNLSCFKQLLCIINHSINHILFQEIHQIESLLLKNLSYAVKLNTDYQNDNTILLLKFETNVLNYIVS